VAGGVFLKDFGRFSSAKGTILELIKANIQMPAGMFIFEDPPAHDAHRSILARVFTPRTVAGLEPEIRRFCAESLGELKESGAESFDFMSALAAHMPMRVMGMLMGVPEEDQARIKTTIDAGLVLEEGKMPSYEEMQNMGNASLKSLFNDYLDYRLANPSDDVMSHLIAVEFEDGDGVTRKLTREEVLGYVDLLAAAGNETTTKLISWWGKLLADHPDQRRLLVADPSLCKGAIEETLRYEAPSPVNSRYLTDDVEFHGQTIPKGSVVALLNASGNRDERHFPDPDKYDVQRKIDHHLSFGYGLHFCLGAALARLEGRVALEEMLKLFPDWTVDEDNAVRARTTTVRGWASLPIHVGS
jgi:cytochrome P450